MRAYKALLFGCEYTRGLVRYLAANRTRSPVLRTNTQETLFVHGRFPRAPVFSDRLRVLVCARLPDSGRFRVCCLFPSPIGSRGGSHK